jgi:hypothetical protein
LIQQHMLTINLNPTTYINNRFKSNNISNHDLEFGMLYNMIVVGKMPYKMCMKWRSKSITLVPFGDFPFNQFPKPYFLITIWDSKPNSPSPILGLIFEYLKFKF